MDKEKELQITVTAGLKETFSNNQMIFHCCILMARNLFLETKLDLFVFEADPATGNLRIRAAGYKLPEQTELDETTILFKFGFCLHHFGFKPGFKFWFKVDDYQDFFLATCLLPEEY